MRERESCVCVIVYLVTLNNTHIILQYHAIVFFTPYMYSLIKTLLKMHM